MQTGPVIITPQIRKFEGKVPYAMRAIHQHFDPFLMGHSTDFFDGKNLSCDVDHMAHH